MRIARLEDRFLIKMGEVTIKIAPLSGRQKVEMTSFYSQDKNGKFKLDKPAQEIFLIKHSIKDISGLKDDDGNDYNLEFEKEGNCLTNDCADELLGFLVNTYFTVANTQAMGGLYGEVMNPYTNTKVEGVSVERVIKEDKPEGKSSVVS